MKDLKPPKLAESLFKKLNNSAYIEDLLGDLEEVYQIKTNEKGRLVAALYYWWQVVRLTFSYALVKRKKDESYSTYYVGTNRSMLINYFKISLRNIWKNRTFTALNVFGLALGMSIALLALAMFVDIKKFDRFHEDADNIYRVNTTVISSNGDKTTFASSPQQLSYQCINQVPPIEESVQIYDYFFPVAKTSGDPISLSGYLTQPSFFQIFDFKLLHGDPSSLLRPNEAIITYELAEKLFGDDDVVGQVIKTEKMGSFKVSGVLEPFPKSTHFSFDLLSGLVGSAKSESDWSEFRSHYFYLKSSSERNELISQINNVSKIGASFFEEKEELAEYSLQGITEINPGSALEDTLGVVFDRPSMFLFFGVTLIILIPACLNYVNISIANSLKRSKEIGIRKVMGSYSRQVAYQFLVETVLISLIAVFFSTFIFIAIRDQYLSMLVDASTLSLQPSIQLILVFIAFAIITGLLSGMIPAFFFSRVSPIDALRKTVSSKKISISGMRRALMVFQFVISLVFMIGIGILLKQYSHSLTYNLGFHKENVLVIPVKGEKKELFKQEILRHADVKDVSLSSSIPGTPLGKSLYFYSDDGIDSIRARVVYVDENFVEHMELGLLSGVSTMQESTKEQVIINEELQKRLINIHTMENGNDLAQLKDGEEVQVVGVLSNYNHEPLNQRIEPMVLRLDPSRSTQALVSVTSSNIVSTIEQLENSWEIIYPNTPFRATFLDSEIEKAYDFFKIALKIYGFLAILAITISCLGLLGMVIYYTENRTKEIAIRKVLGAKGLDLVYSLSGLFFRLWGIAIVIAIPISFYFYEKLFVRIYNKFSDGVGFTEIAISTVFTVALGMLAILWQTKRVIKLNPATQLRDE